MTRVLVTGGTGVLGREVVSRLLREGYTVRIMSRSPQDGTTNVEWAQAQMLTGEGLREALQGVEVIVHAASDSRHMGKTDVEMTQVLLEQAKVAGVGYFLYISIVGVDRTSFAYYQVKVACEALAIDSGIPSASLRLSQLHEFIDFMFHMSTRLPIGFYPKDWQSQPIDLGDAADQVVRMVSERPLGLLPDVAGPEVLMSNEMMSEWKRAQGSHRLVLPIPLPGKFSAAVRSGLITSPDMRVGKVTWEQWLQRRYGQAGQTGAQIGPVYSLQRILRG